MVLMFLVLEGGGNFQELEMILTVIEIPGIYVVKLGICRRVSEM